MDNLKQNSKEDKNEKVPPIDPKNIPPMTYFILSKQGLNSYNLLGEQKKVEPNNNLSFKNVSHLGISEDGELLVLTFDVSRTLKLIDTKTEKVLHDITVDNNIRKILISPLKKYIMTFAHWKSEQKEGNMILWSVQTGEILKRYEQKSLDKWHIQFTPDDEYMLKMENNKIAAYKMTEIEKVETTIEAKGATDFSISNITPYNIAIFTPSIGSKPAFIQIFKWLSFKQPVSSISFFRGHDVQFLWNSRGNALLALVTSTLDSSNNNYYGNTDLYYLKTAGFSCPIEAGKLIHNVAWHKYGKRFAVISGSPPTTTTIYNWEKAEEKENFGRAYVNNAKFSNNGYLLALMGFGTFKGNITIWDQKRVKEICSVDAFTSSTFDWSPDSKYFITATLARMQDNSYKLWHYDGTILLEEKFDSITMAFFKAQSFELFPLKQPSPRLYEKAQQQKKVTQKEETSKYVPPQRRGVGTSSISQKLSELRNLSDTPQYVPPSSSGTSKFDKLGSKNEVQLPFGFGFEPELKKKKKKKPVKKNKATTNNNNNNPNDNISENNSNDNNDNNNNKTLDLPNLHKELNKINQKLREIEKLKNSPNLQPNQKSKLASENQLLHQKMNLEKQISSSKN